MKLRFTPQAAAELDEILDYVKEHSPGGARRIQRRLRDVLQHLGTFPEMGRQTDFSGVRRLVVTPFPYLIQYRIGADEIVILGVRHGGRRQAGL